MKYNKIKKLGEVNHEKILPLILISILCVFLCLRAVKKVNIHRDIELVIPASPGAEAISWAGFL